MKNKNRVGLFFALAALSLSMLNLGLIISKNHYKPQVAKLEQQVEELKKRKPVIIYQVDNAGGELIGTVKIKLLLMVIIRLLSELMANFLSLKSNMRAST